MISMLSSRAVRTVIGRDDRSWPGSCPKGLVGPSSLRESRDRVEPYVGKSYDFGPHWKFNVGPTCAAEWLFRKRVAHHFFKVLCCTHAHTHSPTGPLSLAAIRSFN